MDFGFVRRMAVTLMMGFSSGLPLLATGGTLQAWLKGDHVDLGQIGLFSLVGLPYTLKFLWSPILDRYVPPLLGRRRGWILLFQVLLGLGLFTMGQFEPLAIDIRTSDISGDLVGCFDTCGCDVAYPECFASDVDTTEFAAVQPSRVWGLAIAALCVAFFSASQDIGVDAYRREALAENELALGSGLYVAGYRIAMLISGGLALYLADHLPWSTVYAILGAFMALGALATVLGEEPQNQRPAPKTLRSAVVDPLVQFFRAHGTQQAFFILAFILLYKLGDNLATAMTTPFFLEIGFTKTDIAGIVKTFGMVATITGGLAGGAFTLRFGTNRSLWILGVAQAASILLPAALAYTGKSYPLLVATIATENFTMGMSTTAYAAFMASQTDTRYTATQYALLTALMGVPRVLIASPTGYLAKSLGWTPYFVFCCLCAIPGMLLLFRVAPWPRTVEAK